MKIIQLIVAVYVTRRLPPDLTKMTPRPTGHVVESLSAYSVALTARSEIVRPTGDIVAVGVTAASRFTDAGRISSNETQYGDTVASSESPAATIRGLVV
jgi:hypothetical protein